MASWVGPGEKISRKISDGAVARFNAEGGLRYYLTRRWTLFGEGKYNYAFMNYSSNHSDPTADPFGFRATYSAFTLSLGISYSF